MDIKQSTVRRLRQFLTSQQPDIIAVDYADFERVLQGNDNCSLIEFDGNLTGIVSRLRAELEEANFDKASNAVLHIGYSADVDVQFEQVQSILRIINDAIPNVNLVWGYGIDDKLPDGHCSILLLIG